MRRNLPSLGVVAAGFFLSVIVFATLRSLETKNAQASFTGVAQERLGYLETNVTLTLNSLVTLGAFYDASHLVEREEFDRFTAPLLAHNQAIQALEWIPRVPKPSRQMFEEDARHDGFPSFQFTERLSTGQMARAGEREEYFPVFFVAPFQGNEKALGYDLASDPVRRAALQSSADSGQLVATSRIKLVQETSDQYGFLVFRPLYRGGVEPPTPESRRDALTGFALAVFRVAHIVEAGTIPSSTADLDLVIFDRDANPGERLLYPKGAQFKSVQDLPRGFRATRTISVAGRTWELAAYPRSKSFRPVRWSSWATFLAGLVLTSLLTAHLAGRKRAQEALESSEERYRSLVHNIPDVVWTADATGNFTYISPKIEGLSGFSLEEIAQQGARLFLASIHPDDVDGVRTAFQALFARGEAYDVECRVRRKTGEWIWIRDRALSTYERNGIVYADGVLSNITARKHAEDSLKQSEERARLLFAAIPHPAYVFDLATLDFLEINQAAVQQYGYTRDEFLRMKTTEIRPAEEVEKLKRYLEQIHLHRGGMGQWKHRSKDGRIIDVEIHTHILDYDGHKACLVIAQDVTERNRLEVELRHAQKLEAVGGLAAGIAHEINTPIQFVGDNTRFLRDAFADLAKLVEKYRHLRDAAANGGTALREEKAAAKEMAEEVAEAERAVDIDYLMEEIPKALGQSLDGVTRVAELVRAMKVFAHPDRKEKAATDINEALLSTLTVARNELKYVANVETELGDLPPVVCNIGEVNQVFLNLLVNAAHAIADIKKESDEKGLIRVRTSREDHAVLISISDTGNGIPENIREKIFEPFFTTKESGKGTGQGLAIARSVVVERHGGTLTFTTEIGKGTTFHIRLPLGDEAEQPARDAITGVNPASSRV